MRRLFPGADLIATIHNEIGWIVVNPDIVNGLRTPISNPRVLGFIGAFGARITGNMPIGGGCRYSGEGHCDGAPGQHGHRCGCSGNLPEPLQFEETL